MSRELVSGQFAEALGVLVEAFPKLLDHNIQFVRIVSGDGLADQIFDAVLKASPGHGGYCIKNTATPHRGTSSDARRNPLPGRSHETNPKYP